MTRPPGLLAALGLALLLSIPLAPQPPTPAAEAGSTIHVETVAELQQAILDANSEAGQFAGPDTIIIDAFIEINSADTTNSTEIDGAYAALPDITSAITIQAGGADTIQRPTGLLCVGTSAFRLFNVLPGGDLTLDGITVQHGCVEGKGAGIHNQGTLTVQNESSIRNNEAFATAGQATAHGGGIYNNNGIVTLTDSEIYQNSVAYTGSDARSGLGGGIYNSGDEAALTIERSEIHFNMASASGVAGGQGGGIYHGPDIGTPGTATLIIRNSLLHSNSITSNGTAGGVGGGLRAFAPVVGITNTYIFNNTINASGAAAGWGGGLYLSGIGTFSGNTVDSNIIAADDTNGGWGAGLFLDMPAATIANNTFRDNMSTNTALSEIRGGGLYLLASVETFANNTIANNSLNSVSGSPTLGGGVYFENGAGTFVHNSLVNNTADEGGSLYLESVNIQHFSNNLLAENASGCHIENGVQLSLGHNVVEDAGNCTINDPDDVLGAVGLAQGLQDNGCVTPYITGFFFEPGLCPSTINPVGSVAVDQGDCALSGIANDGRGFDRPVDIEGEANAGDGCDAGAYEFVHPQVGTNPPARSTIYFYGPPSSTAEAAFDIINSGPPGSVLTYTPITLPPGFSFSGFFIAPPLASGEVLTVPLQCDDTSSAPFEGTLNFPTNDPQEPSVSLDLDCSVPPRVDSPTILATSSNCSSFEVSYLARGGTEAASGYLLEIYRAVPGGTDVRVAAAEPGADPLAPALDIDERYQVSVPFEQVFPAGTLLYLAVPIEDAGLQTPPLRCGS